ncbi:MAG: UvrD-helicase domain-containing protein [Bryobacterales bacterium]|nr:UvrD-helicase domain-containing protein [Bryobacterales bacterium]
MTLSTGQRAAVERSGQDVCVVAGPGSGKTRVLVSRFCWLVSQGVSPVRILAITFTEKAATEIKGRIVAQFSQDAHLRAQVERAYVSTVHGFCARLLKENAIRAGVDPDFAILDERTALYELSLAAGEALDEYYRLDPAGFRRLVSGLNAFDITPCLLEVYEARRACPSLDIEPVDTITYAAFLRRAKTILDQSTRGWTPRQAEAWRQILSWLERLQTLESNGDRLNRFRLIAECNFNLNQVKAGPARDAIREIKNDLLPQLKSALISEYYSSEHQSLERILQRLDEIYRRRKRVRSTLDFADLEEQAIRLLKEDERVRQNTANLFDAVLMDELQDTNPLQWELMDLVRRRYRFFAVGDINQSIYGFRHAEPAVFARYRDNIRAQGAMVDELRENHRSRPEILAAVQAVAEAREGVERHELVAARNAAHKTEPSVEVIAAFESDTADAAEMVEATWIARRILDLHATLTIEEDGSRRPLRFSDIGVLVRKSEPMDLIERTLREFGIPALVSRGRGFFESDEVTDLVHWLRVVSNPRDEISLAAVLRSPLVGASDETLLRLKVCGNLAEGLSACESIVEEPEELARLREALGYLKGARELSGYVSPDRLISPILDASGYMCSLDARARANVEKLLGIVRDLFAREPMPLAVLTDHLERLRESQSEPEAPAGQSADVVNVMTIHASKGLEYPVVFVACLHTAVNQSAPTLCYLPGAGLGVRWCDPVSGEAVSDTVHKLYSGRTKERDKAESDRLLYVAMTRAKEHLVLSFAVGKKAPSGWPSAIAGAFGIALDGPAEPAEIDTISGFRLKVFRPDRRAESRAGDRFTRLEAQPLMLARPALEEQFDSTASVTSLTTYWQCPRRYFLERYLQWPTDGAAPHVFLEDAFDSGTSMEADDFGRAVHAVLAGGPRDNLPTDVLEMAGRFETSEFGWRLLRATGAGHECEFVMSFEGLVVRGQIDLWFEEGGELVLIDYKTDRIDPVSDPHRMAAYALQLNLYAAALQKMRGRPVNAAYLYMLHANRAVPVSVDEASLDTVKHIVEALRGSQNRMEFPLNAGGQCFHCPYYKTACPGVTKGNSPV